MSTWSVQLNLQDGDGWFDLMNYTVDGKRIVLVDGFEKTERLFNDTKPTIDTARFRIVMDSSLANALLTNEELILCQIDKDSSAWFTGIARPVTRYLASGVDGGDSIELEIVDNGQRLKKALASDITYSSYKICDPSSTSESIVHQLLVSAGYTLAEIDISETIDVTVEQVTFPKDDEYFETLSRLLWEHHYTFYHAADGDFRIYNWAPVSITTAGSIGNDDVGPELTIEVDDAQEDSVEVEYRRAFWRSNVLLGYTFFGKKYQGIAVIYNGVGGMPSPAYHPDSTGTDRLPFVSGKETAAVLAIADPTYYYNVSEFTTGVNVRHKTYSEASPNPGVSIEVFDVSIAGADFRIEVGTSGFNLSFNHWRSVEDFAVYADVLYLHGNQRIQHQLAGATGVYRRETAKWLFDRESADTFAQALLDRLENSRIQFSFHSAEDYALGGYYELTNSETLVTTTVRIVEVTDRGESDPYRKFYVAEQCAELGTPAGLLISRDFGNGLTAAELLEGSRRAAAGLDGDGYLKQPIDSNTIDEAFEPDDDFPGLYHTHDRLGWWDGTDWLSYLANDGTFKFTGDGSNYLEWDGSKLSVHGDMFLSGDSVIRGTLEVGDTLTVNGDISVLAGGRILGTGYTLSAAALTMTEGSIDLGGGVFTVDNDGNVTANALSATGATISGAITATSGQLEDLDVAGTLTIGAAGSIVAGDATLDDSGIAGTGYSLGVAGIVATAGEVGGWSLGASALTGGAATLHSDGYLLLGSGNDIARLDAQNPTYRLWIGHATAGSAPFRVDRNGAFVSTSATVEGDITAQTGELVDLAITGTLTVQSGGSIEGTGFELTDTGGTIGGWDISTVLRSSPSGRRLELDPGDLRISVINEEPVTVVAIGYLGGLPKYGSSGAEHWDAADYGYWIKESDRMVIDGNTEYTNGSWLIQNDASLQIRNALEETILRFGTAFGEKGIFVNEEKTGSNYRAKLTAQSFFVGNDDAYIDFSSGNLSMRLDSFYVATLESNVHGTFRVSQEGTPESLTSPLEITATGGVGSIGMAADPDLLEIESGELTVNGVGRFVTNTNTTPVKITRLGSDGEALAIGVEDGFVRFKYTNDEAISTIRFEQNNTDTETGGGADASDRITLEMLSDLTGVHIGLAGVSIGTYNVYVSGTMGMSSSLDVGGNLNILGDLYVPSRIYHTYDTNTYMEFEPDLWRIEAGGIEKIRADSDGISIPDYIRHTGDADTYMQFNASNSWRIVTDNTQRLIVNNSGAIFANSVTAASLSAGAFVSAASAAISGTVTAGTIQVGGGNIIGKITVSTNPPSGGSNGDIWFEY